MQKFKQIFCKLMLILVLSLGMVGPKIIKANNEVKVTKIRLKASDSNGNSHFTEGEHENFVLSKDKIDFKQLSFKVNFESQLSATRFRIVTSYQDDNNWSYIGHDGEGSQAWYFQYKKDGHEHYADINGLPSFEQGDTLTVSVTKETDKTKLTIKKNEEPEQSGEVTDEKFNSLFSAQVKVGFGAGKYGDQITDVLLSEIKINEEENYKTVSDFDFYKPKDNQIFEVVQPTPETTEETVTNGEPATTDETASSVEESSDGARGDDSSTTGEVAQNNKVEETKIRLKASNSNGNSHFTANGHENFVLSKESVNFNSLSFKVKFESELSATRFRIVTSYIDDNNWSYIGYDGNDGNPWYFQYKKDNSENWPRISGLPTFTKEDTLTIKVIKESNKTKLSVQKNDEEAKVVEINDSNFNSLFINQVKVGFGAAKYSDQITDVILSGIKINNTIKTVNDFEFYKQKDGQIFEVIKKVESNEDDDLQADAPSVEAESPIDGVYLDWEGTPKKDGTTLEINEDGYLHLKSAPSHGNGTTQNDSPYVVKSNHSLDFSKAGSLSFTYQALSEKDNTRFGIYLGYTSISKAMFIGYDNGGWFWQKYGVSGDPWYSGSRTGAPNKNTDTKVTVTWNNNKQFTLSIDNREVFKDEKYDGDLANAFAFKLGSWSNKSSEVLIKDLKFTGMVVPKENIDKYNKLNSNTIDSNFETFKIENEQLIANLHVKYPAVKNYEIKNKDGNHKIFDGQLGKVDSITLNGKSYAVNLDEVKVVKNSDNALYTFNVKNEEDNIDVDLTVKISVKNRELHLEISKIESKNETVIQTINIPSALLSLDSSKEGANFAGALTSSHTQKSGDEFKVIDNRVRLNYKDYTYAILGDNELSASIWSNSEHDGSVVHAGITGGSHNTRILAEVKRVNGHKMVSLSSAPWYWHRIVTDSKNKQHEVPETDIPKTAVVFGLDENNDNKIDWQDGAIAYRRIMNNPFRSEIVPELVAWRIAMNFGSHAQNPFLMTLDNVKKVYLHTDGLGQSILLKGYGNEGHDSGHPDYSDIGFRIGGAQDMNTLMSKGKEYGAYFGIHVNASEMYPEAKAFSDELVRRDHHGNLRYGWNWIDQGIGIDGIYDLASNSRLNRFKALKELVGDNLEYIYLDVWGNNTSSHNEDSWQTRKMSKMINDNGWRMTTEWGVGNEYDSTFQHWATDLAYGKANEKGFNSQIMRFIRNHQKDSWVADYPSYGGAANAPLLGGNNMTDFEGWQGRNDYDEYIRNLYTHNLTTKFLQHFKVVKWVNNPINRNSISEPQTNNGNEEITLKDDLGNTVVVSRQSNDSRNNNYRKRIIKFNDEIISTGAVSRGDWRANASYQIKGDEAYLLPWLWNHDGKPFEDNAQKLYAWSTNGTSHTWKLPKNWQNLKTVYLYKLTDLGKTDKQEINVSNGQITLNLEASKPYVITKGKVSNKEIKWSEHTHLQDVSFNAGPNTIGTYWHKTGNGAASIVKSQFNNPMAKLSGDVSIAQTFTDLKSNTRYAVYVGVDNRSTGEAKISIYNGDNLLTSNYTNKSIAKNYVQAYTHNTHSATVDGSSYFQNMHVYFTTGSDTKNIKVVLSHKGEGDTYFDDIRIVENSFNGIQIDNDGKLQKFTTNFENHVSGIYPFVVSNIEGVADNRIHMAQKHDPFTQANWDVKKMDDVLEGQWSVKINGLHSRSRLAFQTIPQNIHFEPNKVYRVTFKYQSGSDGIYAFALGNKPIDVEQPTLLKLPKALGETKTYTLEFFTEDSLENYFGIYSTSTAPVLEGKSEHENNFGGYQDFVLDELTVEALNDNEVLNKNKLLQELVEIKNKIKSDNFTNSYLKEIADQMIEAKNLLEKGDRLSLGQAKNLLNILENKVNYPPVKNEAADSYNDLERESYSLTTGSYQPNNETEGDVNYAKDLKTNTIWHTKWSDTNLTNAWVLFTLNTPKTINGLRYLPRLSGENGKLKKVKLIITQEGDKVIEKQHTFTNKTQWQKISFEEIENVKSIKMVVLSSYGSNKNDENKFASATELALTIPKEALKLDDIKLPEIVIPKEDDSSNNPTPQAGNSGSQSPSTPNQDGGNNQAGETNVEVTKPLVHKETKISILNKQYTDDKYVLEVQEIKDQDIINLNNHQSIELYEIKLKDLINNQYLTNFNQELEIFIPTNKKAIKAVYIKDNKIEEEYKVTKVDNGYTFKTKHLSLYGLVYDNSKPKQTVTHNPNWQQDLRKHNEFISKHNKETNKTLPNTGHINNHSILLASTLLTLVAYKLYKKED